MRLLFSGMPSAHAAAMRAGQPDANGQPPERREHADSALPCRHCLGYIRSGEAYLVLAYRPFPALQPYAETGPVFIHAEDCTAYDPDNGIPARHDNAGTPQILRGYGADDRIVYGTGVVVEPRDIAETAEAILARDDIAYVHMRSAVNNCFTLRIDRG